MDDKDITISLQLDIYIYTTVLWVYIDEKYITVSLQLDTYTTLLWVYMDDKDIIVSLQLAAYYSTQCNDLTMGVHGWHGCY